MASLLDALATAAASVSTDPHRLNDELSAGVDSQLGQAAWQRRTRPTHTKFQKAVMSSYYEFNKLPDTKERMAIARSIALPPRAVQVWFQNRRQRQKSLQLEKQEALVEQNGEIELSDAARDEKARALAEAIAHGTLAQQHKAQSPKGQQVDEEDISIPGSPTSHASPRTPSSPVSSSKSASSKSPSPVTVGTDGPTENAMVADRTSRAHNNPHRLNSAKLLTLDAQNHHFFMKDGAVPRPRPILLEAHSNLGRPSSEQTANATMMYSHAHQHIAPAWHSVSLNAYGNQMAPATAPAAAPAVAPAPTPVAPSSAAGEYGAPATFHPVLPDYGTLGALGAQQHMNGMQLMRTDPLEALSLGIAMEAGLATGHQTVQVATSPPLAAVAPPQAVAAPPASTYPPPPHAQPMTERERALLARVAELEQREVARAIAGAPVARPAPPPKRAWEWVDQNKSAGGKAQMSKAQKLKTTSTPAKNAKALDVCVSAKASAKALALALAAAQGDVHAGAQ